MKKAFAWLEGRGAAYRFHDYTAAGLDATKAVALMLAKPSMVKPPVLQVGGRLLVGFSPAAWGTVL